MELLVRGPRALHAHTRARFGTFQGKKHIGAEAQWASQLHKRHEFNHTNDVPCKSDQAKAEEELFQANTNIF
jgi:hypothetical protein